MTLGTSGGDGRDSSRGRWWPLGVLGVTGLIAGVFFALPSGGLVQTSFFVLVAMTGPALLAVRLTRERRLGTRPWHLLLTGVGLYALATTFWGLLPLVTSRELPFPSPVDALYFGSYTLSAAFLVSLLRRRHRRAEDAGRAAGIALLEAGIFAVAMTAILIPRLIGPHLADPDIGGLAQAVAIGYPLGAAVLFGLVARLAIASRSWSPELWLLLLWAGGELAGDIFYGYLSAIGAFAYGDPISVAWLLSYVALGALALHPRLLRLTSGGGVAVQDSRLWLPVGAVLLPLGISLLHESMLLDLVAIVGVLLLIARLRLMSGDLAEQRRLSAELAELSERFEHQSLHDGLTGLANRSLFGEQLDLAWAQEQRHRRGLVVLLIDLDDFKQVNDRFGHHVGDQLLIKAARRMVTCVRETDTLARLSGDEFAVLLPDAGLDHARGVAERIQGRLAAPAVIDDDRHAVRASIGIAVADPRQQGPDSLLQEADTAMYAAKAAGRGTHVAYEPGLERGPTITVRDVAQEDAVAWAAYMRALRREIASRQATNEVAPNTRAPHVVHRALEQVLTAIDLLEAQTSDPTLDIRLPQADLEEFVYHQTAVHHWADALVAKGVLTVTRPAAAERFWACLERRVGAPAATRTRERHGDEPQAT